MLGARVSLSLSLKWLLRLGELRAIVLREDVRCTHQPRGNFPPLTQLRQGRQADVIWKQKNKISGERKTPEAHQGRERPQAKGAWELLKKKKCWEKGQRRVPGDLGIYSGAPSGKTAPWGRAAEGWSLTWAGEAGPNGPGSPKRGRSPRRRA